MKTKRNLLKVVPVIVFFATAMFVSSCTNKADDPISSEVSQTANNEAAVDSQTSEADDMASSGLTLADSPASRTAAQADDRFKCATLTFDSTSNKESGSVTIDFGSTGCTDSKGNIRKGKIIVTWTGGRWYVANSTHVITFSGYSLNDVKFSDNDIRTVHNVSTAESPLTWTVEATHNLTWPDATTASRTVHHTRQWVRSADFVDDKIIVSQTAGADNAASGTNRHEKTYSVQITTPLEHDRSCIISNKVFRPVKGVKVITYGTGKTVTIDFGNGTCDNSFTVTINGHSRSFAEKNDSSND